MSPPSRGEEYTEGGLRSNSASEIGCTLSQTGSERGTFSPRRTGGSCLDDMLYMGPLAVVVCGTVLDDGGFASRSNREGRAVRALALLETDSLLDGGLGGRGLQPAGSDDSDVGRDEVSAMDVGLEDAGGVGGMVWKEERLCVLSLNRSSRIRRSARRWGYGSAAGPTTVAEEALVDAEVAEAWEAASET